MNPVDANIGAIIEDRFRISRLVGEDPAGRRYVARDKVTRKQVRVLLVHHSVMDHHGPAFHASNRALMQLDHPNTVRLISHGMHEGKGYRVSEWSRGSTLLEALEEGRPLQSTAVAWMLDAAHVLEAAHDLGLFHRGLSPSAIQLVRRSEPPDQALLHDWELAPLLEGGDPGSSTGLLAVGGAAWMAPEYIVGSHYDARSEIYALGALLFHCAVGRPPYTGPSMKVLAAHMNEPTPAPSREASGIPHWLDDLVLTMLAKDPAARPQTMSEVAERLTEGSALLSDGAAHPERVTASVPPVRLPKVEIRGAGSTRLPEIEAHPRMHEQPSGFSFLFLAILALFVVGLVSLTATLIVLVSGAF